MGARNQQEVFVDLTGQDDNLGDSALRTAYLRALRREDRRFHIFFDSPTADYLSGFELRETDCIYTERGKWVRTSVSTPRAIHLFNAGEIDPQGGKYPNPQRTAELRYGVCAGGTLIVAGIGFKDPQAAQGTQFPRVFREAPVVSWRDQGSREAAGFGDVAPDWAFSLGTETTEWKPTGSRPLLAVTMRFDRPWPEDSWFGAVAGLAAETSAQIVTLAQVARDAPKAVRLAEALGGRYLVPPSMSHAVLDAYAREIFRQSIAVISDRAHGLIIGATEGAYPIGSAANPQKITRILAAAGLGDLVGRYDQLGDFSSSVAERARQLPHAVERARKTVAQLQKRIDTVIDSV